jgi:hypothetical protein
MVGVFASIMKVKRSNLTSGVYVVNMISWLNILLFNSLE